MSTEGGIERPEQAAFQPWEWRVERAGRLLLVGFLLAALAGLFGDGPWSWRTATSPGGELQVTFERFTRRGAPTTVDVTAGGVEGAVLRLVVGDAFLSSVEVVSIRPQPADTTRVPGGVRHSFPVERTGEVTVVFNVTHEELWSETATFAVAGHPPVRIEQFVYP